MYKERIYSFDFIRALCALGIVVFHYSCQIGDNLFHPLHSFVNGGWGEVFVGAFFILSGAMLFYNYSEISSLKAFYYKRFKSIYPMFYMAFIVFYVWSVISTRNPFYAGNPLKLILSLLGLDGYFQYMMINYYQVGEWFLGAIVMLYALYPIILKLFLKFMIMLTILCILLYGLCFIPNFWTIPISFNFFACLVSFVFGMLIMKYKDKWYNNIFIFVINSVLSLIMLFVPITFIHSNIICHVLSLSLFISLSYIGEYIMKVRVLKRIIVEISMLSFAIFLVHHKIIYKMTDFYLPNNNLISMVYLLVIIVITIIISKLLYVSNKVVLRSKAYRFIEKRFLNNSKIN